MASGRGQSGTRREPVFDSSPELRVGPAERSAPGPDRPAPKPRRKKKKKAARGGGGGKRRPLIVRLTYWSLVACLWLVIGGAGVVAYVGAHLPPIQSLEIPKRPPTIQINDIDPVTVRVHAEKRMGAGYMALLGSCSLEL